MLNKPKWISFTDLPSLALLSSSLKLFRLLLPQTSCGHVFHGFIMHYVEKLHFIMFILSLLTNSLHSDPMRHALASLREACNISIPICFINSPHLPFFIFHSLFALSSYYLWRVLQATQASDLQMHAYYIQKFKGPKAWQSFRDTLFHDDVTCLYV